MRKTKEWKEFHKRLYEVAFDIESIKIPFIKPIKEIAVLEKSKRKKISGAKKIRQESRRIIRSLDIKRDKCSECIETKGLYIHHVDKSVANNSIDNLVVLCGSCHYSKHTNLPRILFGLDKG